MPGADISCIVQKYMPRKKTSEELQSPYVECLLYAFHELAHKVRIQIFICDIALLITVRT
jgi:hypothetical protein